MSRITAWARLTMLSIDALSANVAHASKKTCRVIPLRTYANSRPVPQARSRQILAREARRSAKESTSEYTEADSKYEQLGAHPVREKIRFFKLPITACLPSFT